MGLELCSLSITIMGQKNLLLMPAESLHNQNVNTVLPGWSCWLWSHMSSTFDSIYWVEISTVHQPWFFGMVDQFQWSRRAACSLAGATPRISAQHHPSAWKYGSPNHGDHQESPRFDADMTVAPYSKGHNKKSIAFNSKMALYTYWLKLLDVIQNQTLMMCYVRGWTLSVCCSRGNACA